MSRRMKFQNQGALHGAYARLLDQAWVEGCTIDVPRLEMQVHVAAGPYQGERADAWIARERQFGREQSRGRG